MSQLLTTRPALARGPAQGPLAFRLDSLQEGPAVARIRSMKPELWDDEALGRTSVGSRLLFLGMISLADDEGRLRASPRLLRARLFAYNDDLSLGEVGQWLDALALAKVIGLYEFDGQTFAHIRNWTKHQRVDRPTQSALPGPNEGTSLVAEPDPALESDDLQGTPESSRGFASPREDSLRSGREGNGVEGKLNNNVESGELDQVSAEKTFSSEVVGLCDLLADLIEQNGSKRPNVTEAWKDSGRLLMERDGKFPDEAERVLRWCQADDFWRSNVLSMPTFRKQYDRLRLRMMQGSGRPQGADAKLAEIAEWRRELKDEPEGAA